MKKFLLGFATFICYFTISQEFEANIKVGYDFHRSSTVKNNNNDNKLTTVKYERGFVIGLELLFPITFNNEKIKLGAGFEYNFGETNVRYKSEKQPPFITTMIPLYATAKFTYYRPKNIDLNLYTFARLGFAFAGEAPTNNKRDPLIGYGIKNTNGLYYGLGLGIDYKYFLAEILYDGKYSYYKGQIQSIDSYKPNNIYTEHDFHHKIGLRLGLQLGTQHFKKPKVLSLVK